MLAGSSPSVRSAIQTEDEDVRIDLAILYICTFQYKMESVLSQSLDSHSITCLCWSIKFYTHCFSSLEGYRRLEVDDFLKNDLFYLKYFLYNILCKNNYLYNFYIYIYILVVSKLAR